MMIEIVNSGFSMIRFDDIRKKGILDNNFYFHKKKPVHGISNQIIPLKARAKAPVLYQFAYSRFSLSS